MLQPAKPSQPVYPIPIDIYRIIISQLSPAELAACLRVSRLTHTLALTKLYRKITIDLDEEVNPLFNRSSKKGLGGKHKARYSGSRGKGEGSGLKGVLGGIIGSKRIHSASSTAPRSPPQEPLPNRFSYTTDLTITSHSQPLCTDFPPLIMPQLHTLRITPTFQENHLNICHCRHHPAYHKATDPCSCPLLRELRPRRVILGSDVTGLSGSAKGLWPPFPPVWVKEVVVYLGSCTGIEIGPEATTSLVDKFPNTVEKLVLVFRPRHWPFHNGGRWQFRRVAGIEGALDPLLLWRAIGKACSGNAKRIEVAGLETVDRDWTELPIKVEQEAIRREMRKALQLKGAKSEDVEKSLGALVFKGRASYSED